VPHIGVVWPCLCCGRRPQQFFPNGTNRGQTQATSPKGASAEISWLLSCGAVVHAFFSLFQHFRINLRPLHALWFRKRTFQSNDPRFSQTALKLPSSLGPSIFGPCDPQKISTTWATSLALLSQLSGFPPPPPAVSGVNSEKRVLGVDGARFGKSFHYYFPSLRDLFAHRTASPP